MLACALALALVHPDIFATTTASGAGAETASGGVSQVVIGLATVLAVIGAIAWLLRRFSGLRGNRSGLIQIVGGAAVGQRERIVLVEVGGIWLLVGVAPGQVRTLHTMPKSEAAAAPDAPAPEYAGFSTWLRRMSEKRDHD